VKPGLAGFVTDRCYGRALVAPGEISHGFNFPDYHGLRGSIADHVRGKASDVFLEYFVAAMRHERTALHCAMDRGASELERREVALRISALQGQSAK
jgi:hypothetical protein